MKKEKIYAPMHDKRKKQIIQITKELILQNGIESLNMKQLSEKLGISRVTLYKYFSSIEEIVVEIEKDIIEKVFIGKTHMNENDIRESIENFINTAFENKDDFIFNNIFDIYVSSKNDSPILNKEYEKFVLDNDPFPKYIESLQKKNLIRSDINPINLAFSINYIIIGSLERLVVLQKNEMRNVPQTDNEYKQILTDMIINYVKKQ